MLALLFIAGLAPAASAASALRADAAPYRAACDGKTDDSAAIQACVDDSARLGAPCELPPAVCVFGARGGHAALVIPDGGGLTGSGSRGVHASTLRLETDGGGRCALAVNGAVRMKDGNSTKLLANLRVESGDPALDCLVNASNAVKQVAGVRIEDADLFPPKGSSATVALFLGNIVTSRFERDYFAVGFAAAVVDGGAFSNSIHFRDDFFDELHPAAVSHFMVDLGTLSGSSFTGGVFESGPNALRVRGGTGVVVSDNWMGDMKDGSGGTWLSVAGGGTRVSGNFMNCEGRRTHQTGISVSGRGGHVVEGNWIDGASIGIVAAGDANVVKGNEIFYPESIGVELGAGAGQEIGPNHVEVGRRARPVVCDGKAASDKIVVVGWADGPAERDCASRNTVEDLTRRSR